MNRILAALLGCAAIASVEAQTLYLRQSTASQVVSVGPFLDPADGTAEGSLTIDATDVRLKVNGGADAAKNSGGCTHDINGMYDCTFDATDTATVGRLNVTVCETGAVCVSRNYHVLEEVVYDEFVDAGAVGPLLANANGSVLTEAGGTGDHLTAIDLPNQTMDISGTITNATNVTNLTNAPTAGDFTATMKTSGATYVGTALATYDPPTRAELTADITSVLEALGRRTTITVTDQDTFVLAEGSTFNDAYNGWAVKIEDAGTQDEGLAKVLDYVGASKTVELEAVLGFTIATGDTATLYPAFLQDLVSVNWAEAFTEDTGLDETDAVAGSLLAAVGALASSGGLTAADIWNYLLATCSAESGSICEAVSVMQTELDGILADTNEVQVTLAAGGTIESLVDDVETLVADVPTNAELATSQASADDATLAAIAALNNLSAANVRDLVIEDQGSGVSLGCAIAVVLAYAAGDLVTSGSSSTYEDPSGTETRATGTVSSAGNRTAAITCPTY